MFDQSINQCIMAKDRQLYETPAVHRRISIELEGDILAGSVVDDVSGVNTSGQTKGDLFEDASSTGGSTFNHSWGE